jgi:transposase InsO family protein
VTIHPNAKLTPQARQLLVQRVLDLGWSMQDAAQAVGVSVRTGWRWLRRFRDGGRAALHDRRSTPHRRPRQTSRARVAQIARRLGMPRSTVAAVLRRMGLQRLSRLEPKPPVQRYEHPRPGDLLHLDTKKLGRFRRPGHRVHGDRTTRARAGVGWDFTHAAIDDHSRFAYVETLGDELGDTAADFLRRAVRDYRRRGIRIRAVLTDNGGCYLSKAFAQACRELRIEHRRTRPYRPRTNGKAERFIQTLLREWAYARPYRNSNQRIRALPPWLRYYNAQRPHSALGGRPPLTRIRRTA